MFRIHICILFFTISSGISGQHIPRITNFSFSDYKAHHQNWGVVEDDMGNLYSANTMGLLYGNGNTWETYKLRFNKTVRSVAHHEGKIYSGSYGEFGYWEKDKCGSLVYWDLTENIDVESFENEEVWNIVSDEGSIWFQSFSLLMVYDGKKFSTIQLPGAIMFLHIVNGKKYVQSLENGIFNIRDDLTITLLEGSSFFNDKIVTGILPYNSPESLLITTNNHGIFVLNKGKVYPWNTAYQNHFISIQINKAFITKDLKLILGSINAGAYVFDMSGKYMYHFNTGNGLQNNTILSIYENKTGDLWLGMDKGLAKIHLSSDALEFNDKSEKYGSVYTAIQKDSTFYLGTNQGVYFYKNENVSKDDQFSLINGTQGQTWQLFEVNGKLYCGHNEGTFLIEDKEVTRISDLTGGWYNEVIPGSDGKLWLQGNYTGLAVFKLENDILTYSHKIEGYPYPAKKFIFKNEHLWVASPNMGLLKLTLDINKEKVVQQKNYEVSMGLPNGSNIDLYVFKDKIRAYNGENHFVYDDQADRFRKDTFMNSFVQGFLVRPLQDEYWLRVYHDHTILMKDSNFLEYNAVTLTKDYHNIVRIKENRYLYCLEDGYYLQTLSDTSKNNVNKNPNIQIYLSLENQKCLRNEDVSFPLNQSSMTLHFFDYDFEKGKQYFYRLLPTQNEWKSTHSTSHIDITNIAAGDYTVEIMRNDGVKGVMNFTILPPWYASAFAKIFYLVVIGLVIFFIIKYHENQLAKARQKFENEQKRLVKEHQMEIENQLLVQENRLKNKELANTAMQLIKKNEILKEIKSELIEIRKSSHHTLTAKDFQIIMKQINNNLTLKKDKELFDDSFEEIHYNFLTKLKAKFPRLSKDDMRLAVYIRLKMPSKEMAPLFNISLRGLENRRYRLKGKLGLEKEDDIIIFLQNIEESITT